MHHAHWQTLVVLILSGNYVCSPSFDGNGVLLVDITWIIGIGWEVLALSLAVWVAVKHLRELRQSSSGGILEDCFTVLIKTHVVYFARWVYIVHVVLFFAEVLNVLVFLLYLASRSAIYPQLCQRYVDSLTSVCEHDSSLYRTHFPWTRSSFLASLRYSRSYRWLCWGRAWSWVFENLTLRSWPTLMQEPLWVQSLSRSTCI